jgi:phage terminase large subunit GpA-like protein
MEAALWSSPERQAWRWPDRPLPSQWIETNLRIPDNSLNPEPGLYSFNRTPWWRDVVDLAVDPVVREVWCYKFNQAGFTQLMIAFMAYCACQDPGALGLLMPDEDSIDEIFAEQIVPAIDATPALKALKSGSAWDSTKHEIWLRSMPILGLYSGSSSKLEKRALRYAVGDEINIYKGQANQASAIERLLVRTRNWGHRGKVFFGSKPTSADGHITRGYESCPEKRHYWMPCPRCGRYQDWRWFNIKGFKEAKGNDKNERANWVLQNKPCYYECDHCKGRIEEKERGASVAAGRWVSGVSEGQGGWKPTQGVDDNGCVTGDRIASSKVGVYIWGIVSPWLSFHEIAAKFVEAEGDDDKTRSFRNSILALPFDQVIKSVRPSKVRDKIKVGGDPMVVPEWATGILACFDTQKDYFVYVIRAWGLGFKSQMLAYGQCHGGFDEVYRVGLQSRFKCAGGGEVAPMALLIDSGGDKTNEVYDFSLRDRGRIIPTKGYNRDGTKLFFRSSPKPGVDLWIVNVHQFKSDLHALIYDPDITKWLPHNKIDEDYCIQMASEHYVKDKGRMVWKETGASRNDYWDIEVLQRAGAEMFNLAVAPAVQQEQEQPIQSSVGGQDWIPERPNVSDWMSR